MLACLAWLLLLGAVRADDLQSFAERVQLVAAQTATATEQVAGETASGSAEPAESNSPMLGTLFAPPEKVIVEPEAWPQPTQWPTADPPVKDKHRSRIWQYVPLGMVPFGPRTPNSQKDRGIGLPLVEKGWRSQPFSITPFAGVTDGGALIRGHVNQEPSFYGGLNFGWDYDHYWGFEKRLGFGALNLSNADHQPIVGPALSVTGEYRLMYYPLGDARWRPYLTAGVGWSDFYYNDDVGRSHLDTVGMIPFGVGVKYLYTGRIAFRVSNT